MRFRGREMAHQNLGLDVLNRVRDDLEKMSKVEQFPKMEGRHGAFSKIIANCTDTPTRQAITLGQNFSNHYRLKTDHDGHRCVLLGGKV